MSAAVSCSLVRCSSGIPSWRSSRAGIASLPLITRSLVLQMSDATRRLRTPTCDAEEEEPRAGWRPTRRWKTGLRPVSVATRHYGCRIRQVCPPRSDEGMLLLCTWYRLSANRDGRRRKMRPTRRVWIARLRCPSGRASRTEHSYA
jgi:hypothetical protein